MRRKSSAPRIALCSKARGLIFARPNDCTATLWSARSRQRRNSSPRAQERIRKPCSPRPAASWRGYQAASVPDGSHRSRHRPGSRCSKASPSRPHPLANRHLQPNPARPVEMAKRRARRARRPPLNGDVRKQKSWRKRPKPLVGCRRSRPSARSIGPGAPSCRRQSAGALLKRSSTRSAESDSRASTVDSFFTRRVPVEGSTVQSKVHVVSDRLTTLTTDCDYRLMTETAD